MLYQTAKSELQSPPHRVSMVTLLIEAGAVVTVAMALVWVI
ncbi:MAG TPA: hypothetical protein PLY75_08720 [Gammaproteobacteria bacterium]|nr:hypothetical protein [Gammaproteobacteria bacterium]HPQ25002.1 hypothetical protein [Gammaproteobacteria bacterium]